MNKNRLIFLLKKYDYVVVFLLLVIVSVVLMSRTSYYQSSKLISWTNSIVGGWYQGVHSISGYFGLKSENDRLAEENARLRAQLEESYIKYNDSVFTVNDTTYRQRYSYTEAQVIKNSWNQQNNYVMINKGSSHGIKPDMAVISPDGIVGVVMSVSENFATIMPVLHSDSRNSVKVKRTGISGSLVWDGADYRYAQVIDVPTTHKFLQGDTIITSGLANDFPEGIPVGYVMEAENLSGSGFYIVKIRLATDFNKLDHVYIINDRFGQEMKSLMDRTEKRDNE
ncbi:MAG: rod shape-determining protein MreC [Bacteroidales bacterium]|nr:rod shape-determining protein MreC [Bacteroidales bacterium]